MPATAAAVMSWLRQRRVMERRHVHRLGRRHLAAEVAAHAGVEHADHALQDLVSEFVWVRPPRSTKRFYVVDSRGKKCEVPPSTRVLWFDDRLKHGIFPVDDEGQVSIRIDGRFCAAFRERSGLCRDQNFTACTRHTG